MTGFADNSKVPDVISGCMSSVASSTGPWCMCQGRLCHSVWLYFVLIAIAIQGVTPDAQDLASIKSLWLFCPALAGSRHLAAEDGLPDEVCGPAQPEMDAVSHGSGRRAG